MSLSKQLTFLMIILLVLFSTLSPAGDHVEIHNAESSCLVRYQWNALCIQQNAREQQPQALTVDMPIRWVDAPHSLESSVRVHFSLNLAFMDPVAVVSYLAMGTNILLLLGMICWTIFTTVWLTCSAAVARINPLHTTNPLCERRALIQCNVKHKHIHQGELISLHFCNSSLPVMLRLLTCMYLKVYGNQPCISRYI